LRPEKEARLGTGTGLQASRTLIKEMTDFEMKSEATGRLPPTAVARDTLKVE